MSLRFKGECRLADKKRRRREGSPAAGEEDEATREKARVEAQQYDKMERETLKTMVSYKSSTERKQALSRFESIKAAESAAATEEASSSTKGPAVDSGKAPAFSSSTLKQAKRRGEQDPISIFGDLPSAAKKPKPADGARLSEYERMVDRRAAIKSDRMCKGGIY
eukprot:RCo007755